MTKAFLASHGVRMVAKARFAELGAKLIGRGLAPISREWENRLFSDYFPEAEIPAACTIRRSLHRENSAKLEPTFLDIQQEWASKLDLEMAPEQTSVAGDFSVRLINGVAGSGKTLIAVNRALLLAELFPTQRLLLLIHNTPIVADLNERLHRAHGGLPTNLTISTFFSWAHQQWRSAFRTYPKMMAAPRVQDIIKRLRAKWPDIKQTDAQILDEMDFINQSLVTDQAAYLAASRAGRGYALRPTERTALWELFLSVTRELAKSQQLMWSALPLNLSLANTRHEHLKKFTTSWSMRRNFLRRRGCNWSSFR